MFRVVAYGFIFRVCGVEGERKILSFINIRTGNRIVRTSFVAALAFLFLQKKKAFQRRVTGVTVWLFGVGALVWHRCFLSVL